MSLEKTENMIPLPHFIKRAALQNDSLNLMIQSLIILLYSTALITETVLGPKQSPSKLGLRILIIAKKEI